MVKLFDKSIHPVVLYKYYLICMFMNIHEGKSCKNYKPRGGVEVRSILHSEGLLNSSQILFSGTLGMRNGVLLKTFWYGLCENAWFPWQPRI